MHRQAMQKSLRNPPQNTNIGQQSLPETTAATNDAFDSSGLPSYSQAMTMSESSLDAIVI